MGGNSLLTYTNGVKLDKQKYEKTVAEVLLLIKSIIPNLIILPLKHYNNKELYGDIDLIYHSDIDVVTTILNSYKPEGYTKNGNIFSFCYASSCFIVQVDLIRLSSNAFNFGYNYYNYSIGSFLGRVFHKAGFKLGHEGLKYIIRDHLNTNHIIEEITVTLDWQEAMDFMDYSSYSNHSFETLEDIFKFTVSSKYSNKDIYLLENRNHISRMRDKKRPTYTAFLRWLNENECSGFDWNSVTKTSFLIKAFDIWPQFKNDYIMALNRYWRSCKIKEKFNGYLVSEITGLKDKELGMFIRAFKEKYSIEFILSSSPKEIELAIQLFNK